LFVVLIFFKHFVAWINHFCSIMIYVLTGRTEEYGFYPLIWEVVIVIVWYLDLQLPMQSVPITTKVVNLNPFIARCTRYSIMW
jgi:hypothetical protein